MKIGKNIILLSATIITLISLIALATYSYFTAAVNTNNKITTSTQLPLRPTFTVSGGGELTLTITRDMTLQENAYTGTWTAGVNQFTSSKNLTITLTDEPGTTCTYNVYYKDTSSNSAFIPPESWDFYFSLSKNGTRILGDGIYLLKQTSAGTPKITTFFGGSTAPLNQSKPTISIPSGKTSATDTWQFNMSFLNFDLDQSYLANKTFKGELYIDDVSCT